MSATVVLKFGGSSVASPDRIRRVAKIVASHRQKTEKIVVVVSAMGDTTDNLIDLAKQVSTHAEELSHRREMDMLLSTGERISMALLSMALSDLGVAAISLTGSQSGIITTPSFGEACIQEIKPIRITESLAMKKVVIVAGFQGVSTNKEITTLGRGGSDTSAVALAISLGAKECVIYTDVDGYYSADPRKVSSAKKIEVLPWQLAIEGASRGAQVLHPRCVELAWKYSMPVRVCTSLLDNPQEAALKMSGTKVEGVVQNQLESSKVYSVALQKNLIRVHITSLKNLLEVGEYFSQAASRGFRYLSWSFENGVLKVLMEAAYLNFLDGLSIAEKHPNLSRLSLIGTGFTHSADVVLRLMQQLNDSGAQVLDSKIGATFLEMTFSLDPEKLDGLLEKAHSLSIS